MQGKTQVFPVYESDFFRNRLTHSLEVAQIAEGIADKLNHDNPEAFERQLIDARLCAAAALIHDLGHPPFGHNGERALDRMMCKYGGFEGNAQSLRIVTRLEKKAYRKADDTTDEADDEDGRLGLNLTYRVLAAILKYDNLIPHTRKSKSKVCKGYYGSEKALVGRIKRAVCPGYSKRKEFKTLECQIMDLADDIAYSTYDLEDCLKAGFLTPAIIMSSSPKILESVAKRVGTALKVEFSTREVLSVFESIFRDMLPEVEDDREIESESDLAKKLNKLVMISEFNEASRNLAENSHDRTQLSGDLVGFAIRNVKLKVNREWPALSKVWLTEEAERRVEVLKQYTYTTTIDRPRVKVSEFRGYSVVKDIFKALDSKRGSLLMPPDVRAQYETAPDESDRKRAICDYVAGMTDRYALEFYARLHSDSAQSMFKPL